MKSSITIFIYYNEAKTICRIVKPSDKFDGNTLGLVEALTNSDFSVGIKRYHHYEVV